MRRDLYELFQAIPNYRRLSYLELGCGDGFMIDRLRLDGAAVRGTTFLTQNNDYIRSREYPPEIQVDGGCDLNKPLPYVSETFDVVYTIEVIEHIEGHRNLVAEAARVLKPGGWFVMTTPNLHRLISRLHFMITGVHLVKERRPPYSAPVDRMGEFHIRCPEFPTLHWIMWQCGLRIEAIDYEYVHPLSRALWILVPLLRLFTQPALRWYQRPAEDCPEAVADLVKWMNSTVLMSSERIWLRARKITAIAL